jgi:hypothetical protein
LPVLSWTLAISQIFAQNQLPASVQPYAVNWSYAVKDMLQAAGYEVPGPKSNVDLLKTLKAVLKNFNWIPSSVISVMVSIE